MGVGELALIVEHNAKTRGTLTRICHRIGVATHGASSWREAELRIKKRYYDFIILDIDLPGSSCIETIRAIRRLGLDPCILVTAPFKSSAAVVSCLKAGAYDTILKPIRGEWARVIISRALERRRFYDDAQKKDHYWKLSIFDELTRIHNHRYFHYLLTKGINSAQRHRYPLSLLMMDLDNFKEYNDRYGHLAGDEVLKTLGPFFSGSIRAGDIVARYGGEEFAMILPHTNKSGARVMAEKLRRQVERLEFTPHGVAPHARLTISIGVASFPLDAKTKDELIKVADMALYCAKRENKNKVCCR